MLASFTDSGAGLSLALGANDAVGIVANPGTYTFSLTSGTWSGTNDANVVGNGTATLTVQKAAFNQVSLTDSGGGASVKFNDSGINSYSSSFTVALTNASAGSIAFNGATAFAGSNSLSASTSDFIVANPLSIISANSGSIVLSANQQLTPTGGTFIGIDINNATVQSATGGVALKGTGGNTGSNNYGVEIHAGGKVQATGAPTADISITGSANDGTSAAIAFANGGISSLGYATLTANGGSITETADAGPDITAAAGATFTTTGSHSAVGTTALPIRTAIGALTATTNDGGIFIADSNGPGLAINTVLAQEGGQVPFLHNNHIVVDPDADGPLPPQAGTFDISITALGPVVVNNVTAPDALTIGSVTGQILDYNQASPNVLARSVNLVADGAVGMDSDPLELVVESSSASTTNGGIFLSEGIDGTVASVAAGGAGNQVVVTSTAATLLIKQITALGNVTVASNGGLLLDDNGAAVNLTGQVVDLTGKSGIGTAADPMETAAAELHATVSDAAAGIWINETNGLSSVAAKTNAGDVTINFTGGPLTYVASSEVLSASGAAVTFETTAGNVKLGLVDAGSGAVNVTAPGEITDDVNDSAVDLRGGAVTLHASTGIGASGNEIDTDVAALDATTDTGDIFIREANALSLSALSKDFTDPLAQTGSEIDVRSATGDMTLGRVSALGSVILHAGGAILDGNGVVANVSAEALDLTASNGIGSSGDGLETSVDSLTANGGAGGLFLANAKELTLTSATTGGDVAVSVTGELLLGTVTAPGKSVTLSASGELIDGNGPAVNITAASATLNASEVGNSGDRIETNVAGITAATTSGGISITNVGAASLALTATALGQAANVEVESAGSIVLNTVTAQGDTVNLRAGGSITDGNDTPSTTPVNIIGKTLEIVAPGGIGTPANPLEVDVDQAETVDGGAGGTNLTNAGPLGLTESALESSGSGTLTFDAESITVFDIADNTATIAPGRSVVLRTQTGPIVFLDPEDTIQTQGAGTITIQAGTIAGSGGVAVLGNLKTAGGNILVTADRTTTIGKLDAGTGDVTVRSLAGVIVDGNGPAVNVIAGTTTLSGAAPTAREAELEETFAIAEAAAASAEAAAKETSAEAFESGAVIVEAAEQAAEAVVETAKEAAEEAEAKAEAQISLVLGLRITEEVLDGLALGLKAGAEVLESVADGAQAIPVIGDLGAAEIANVMNIAAEVAEGVAQVFAFALIAEEQKKEELISEALNANAKEFAAESTLHEATATAEAFHESSSIATAAAEKAAIIRDALARVRDQAIAARDQDNVLGTAAAPLGIQVSGVVNVSANAADSYLQVVGNTALNQILATGGVTLISTGAITNGAGVGTPNIVATGLTIVAVNGIGTAAKQLLTRVGTLNATNTGSGDIDISNTYGAGAPLNITGVSNSGGGNVVISNKGNAGAGQGITVSGPISAAGPGTVAINSGSPLTIAANVTSASAITLSAGETPAAGDDLTVSPGVTIQSTGSSVTLQAGDNVTVPTGATIQAAGTITITGDHASADAAGTNVVVTGTLIATSALINVDAGDTDNDVFTVTPSALTPITVDGGGGSDTLNYNADGLLLTIVGNVITASGRAPVTFSSIEAVNLLNAAGGGSVTLDAAPGVADNVVLTGTALRAGTYTENGGIPVSFSGVNSFTFIGADKNDVIAVAPFATSLQQWKVAVAVDGGGGQNALTLNGVSGVSENITIQPSARGAGQVIDTNAATAASVAVISYVNNTNISVNGSNTGATGDTDNLFVNGTGPANPGVSGNEDALANFQAAGNATHPMVRIYDAGSGAVGGHPPSAAELADTEGAAANDLFNLQNFSNFGTLRIGLLGGNDVLDILAGAQSGPLAPLAINYTGGLGDDSLIVSSTNGAVLGPINYDGGPGTNYLTLTGGTATSDTYTPGSQLGSGTNTLVFPGGTESVTFQNLAPIFDQVAGPLSVSATNANNAITYQKGNDTTNTLNPAWGQVSVDNLEPINFTNKSTLTVNGLAGTDTFSLNNPNTPTGLTSIAINGAPASGDTLTISGAGAAVSVNTGTATITGGTGTFGAVSISYSGIAALNLAANIGNLTLTTTGADDILGVTPGVSGASNSGSLVSSGVVPSITFASNGMLTANLGGGNDAVNVMASANSDTIAVSDAAVAITGRNAVNYTGVESIAVNGLAGSDIFNVTSSATVPISIDGNDPIGVLPGDQLNILTNPGDSATLYPGVTSDQGGFVVNSNQPVSFVHIESMSVSGGGTPVINGTNGNDVISIVARDSSYSAGLDGIQDFTIAVNSGPNLLFVNTPSAKVNAQAGNDQIIVQAPAPNLAAWNVAVTVDGGVPSINDQLVVIAPGKVQTTYTPAPINGGTLGIAISGGTVANISIANVESFTYDGQAGGDTFTMVGTSGANLFTLTPGAANDAGTLNMDGALPVTFQKLGTSGQIVVKGNGGADSLIYNGTGANDAFVINSSTLGGQVNLNAAVPLLTQNVQTLSLEGLAGDDTFTLLPGIGTNPYTTLNLDGGATASATGNQATLTAAALSVLSSSGQTITQGGKTVAGTSLQKINLAGAGNDLTYTGVNGVTEAINIIASPTAGLGQLSIPNVALWSFTAVPVVYVNGNPADNDTLTFTGTNNNDVYLIHLEAAGTDAAPVLQLQDATSHTLLTLGNYSGFGTLNVSGLDGADTYNVYTAATAPSDPNLPGGRNLFINGNLPSGKKKQTNVLHVFYSPKRPKIVQTVATQDPTSGQIQLDYGTAVYLIGYAGIQNVTIAAK